jgi:hypothetical protein
MPMLGVPKKSGKTLLDFHNEILNPNGEWIQAQSFFLIDPNAIHSRETELQTKFYIFGGTPVAFLDSMQIAVSETAHTMKMIQNLLRKDPDMRIKS